MVAHVSRPIAHIDVLAQEGGLDVIATLAWFHVKTLPNRKMSQRTNYVNMEVAAATLPTVMNVYALKRMKEAIAKTKSTNANHLHVKMVQLV